MIEVVVYLGVITGKFLEHCTTFKLLHRPFLSSKWQVRIFTQIVCPATGHVHRAIFGNWRGISYSCMRGLNHQVALELKSENDKIQGNFEPPAYGVVLLSPDTVTVHLHDFSDQSENFEL